MTDSKKLPGGDVVSLRKEASGRVRKCPACGAPAVMAHRPFCSERCRMRDLGRWLSEEYRVPGGIPADDDDFPPQEN